MKNYSNTLSQLSVILSFGILIIVIYYILFVIMVFYPTIYKNPYLLLSSHILSLVGLYKITKFFRQEMNVMYMIGLFICMKAYTEATENAKIKYLNRFGIDKITVIIKKRIETDSRKRPHYIIESRTKTDRIEYYFEFSVSEEVFNKKKLYDGLKVLYSKEYPEVYMLVEK